MLVFVLAAPPCGRKHRKPTKPGWEPIQGWADGVGSWNLHCTFKTHVIFTKLARLYIEKGWLKAGNVSKRGVSVLVFCASSAPTRQKTSKAHKTWSGTYPGMGWWGGFIKLTLYIQNPCHIHETCQTYRESVTEFRKTFKTGGWCACFVLAAPPRGRKHRKTTRDGLMGWVHKTYAVH